MKKLHDLKIGPKIVLAFLAVVAVFIISGGVIISSVMSLRSAESDVARFDDINDSLIKFETLVNGQREAILQFLVTGDLNTLERFKSLNGERLLLINQLRSSLTAYPDLANLAGEDFKRVQNWVDGAAATQIQQMRHHLTVNAARALEASGTVHEEFIRIRAGIAKLNEARKDLLGVLTKDRQAHLAMVMWSSLIGASVSALLAIFLGVTLRNLIATPINEMTLRMSDLSQGNLNVAIRGTSRNDEIGAMARALEVFKEGMRENRDLQEREKEAAAQKESQRKKQQDSIRAFEGTVVGVLEGLSNADMMLRKMAQTMTSGSQHTAEQATTAADTSETASNNVNTVAAAAEELRNSIQEISQRVAEASTVSSQAVTRASGASDQITALEASVGKIGEVVDLITDIADQTNLLALNATIEAARAGEAGKGFAVVANEVKHLANQTAKATGDIARQIGEVQQATKMSVGAIGEIAEVIRNINQISTSIASAVEEQTAATAEIARNVEEASAGTQQVSSVMADLKHTADDSKQVAENIHGSSERLSKEAATLKQEVARFLQDVNNSLEEEGETAPMELVEWAEEYAFGDAKIDTEHHELLDLINDLYRQVKSNASPEALSSAHSKLEVYASDHFAHEEAAMERMGYPDLAQHTTRHKEFIDRLDSTFAAYRHGDGNAGVDLLALMSTWWKNHIAEDDAQLAQFVRARKMAAE